MFAQWSTAELPNAAPLQTSRLSSEEDCQLLYLWDKNAMHGQLLKKKDAESQIYPTSKLRRK